VGDIAVPVADPGSTARTLGNVSRPFDYDEGCEPPVETLTVEGTRKVRLRHITGERIKGEHRQLSLTEAEFKPALTACRK
jgi:hypothetical protein